MNGLSTSLMTVFVTVIISFLVAIIVRLLTAILGTLSKATAGDSANADTLLFRDESEIASVIAIALTLKK